MNFGPILWKVPTFATAVDNLRLRLSSVGLAVPGVILTYRKDIWDRKTVKPVIAKPATLPIGPPSPDVHGSPLDATGG